MNNIKLTFLFSLIYLSLVGWSSNNWIMIWFTMEVIFLFFVGLAFTEVNYSNVELMMKYFVSQVFISLMFASTVVFCMFNLGILGSAGLGVVLLMKLGMFPFHVWMIMVLGKVDWLSFLMLISALKLLPLLLLSYLNHLFSFYLLLLMSVVAGSLMGSGNLMVQKLLGYSSLVHLCWLVVSLEFSTKIFFLYFFSYFIMMMVLVSILSTLNFFYLNQFKILAKSLTHKFFFFFFILSLAGFPPFMGFLMKWVVASLLVFYDMKVLMMSMILFSLFSIFFYLELFYFLMMMSSMSISWFNVSLSSISVWFFLVLLFYGALYFFI